MYVTSHISDALACLHWLRVPERIEFKIAVLTYKVLHEHAPGYVGPFTPGMENITIFSKISKISKISDIFDIYRICSIVMFKNKNLY